MNAKLQTVLGFLAHYKYLITIVIGVAYVGFFDENSFLQRIKYDMRISQLKEEIEKYETQNEADNVELKSLKQNPQTIRKIARERYFMKKDDEDIFVLSTDKPVDDNSDQYSKFNEATK